MPEWTAQETDILKKSWADGYSASQISRILYEAGFKKRSRNAIIGRASRSKLSDRKGKNNKLRRADNPDWGWFGGSPKKSNKKPVSTTFAPRKPTPLPREVIKTKQKIQNEPAPDSAKTLMDLGPCQCKHPYGQGDYKFCGQPTDGGSYCKTHRSQNYLRGGK